MYNYVVVFSSFYKAVYAQEKLSDHRIKSGLMRVSPDLIKSCGYGVFLNEKDLENSKKVLKEAHINWQRLFQISQEKGKQEYKPV